MTPDPDPAAGGTPPAPDAAASAAAAAAAAKSPSQPDAAAAAASETPAGEKPAAEKPAAETPAAEKPAAEKPAAEKPVAEPPAGAPEKYSLAMPEGTALDAEDLQAIETVARANNLTNEAAQTVLENHAKAVAARHTAWLDQTRADTEVGGTNLEASQRAATQVLDTFMPASDADAAALRRLLTHDGLGNYRPMVKLLARIGKAMGEDTGLQARGGGTGQRSTADVMFGDFHKQP